MSVTITRYLGLVALVALVLLWVMPTQTAHASLSFSGIWTYDEDDAGDMLQSYRQTITAGATQNFTPIFSLEEHVRHGYLYQEQNESRETIAPGLTGLLYNQLFSMDVSASTLQTLSEASKLLDNENVELNLASKWQRDWWPNLSVTVSQSSVYDTLDPHHLDRSQNSLNGVVDWRLNRAFLYYTYRRNEFVDNVVIREDILDSQLATLKYSDGFFGNRLQLSFSQEYTQDKYEHNIGPNSGSNLLPRIISLARVGTDATPTEDIVTAISPSNVPALTDGDTGPFPPATVAYNVPQGDMDNNILITVTGQSIQKIYLYTQNDLTPYLPVASNWQVYHSNPPWTPITTTVSYNSSQQRYEISMSGSVQAAELKLVFDNPLGSGAAMEITEIEAYGVGVVGVGGAVLPDSELTTSRTRLSLDAALSKTLKFKYGFSLSNEETDLDYQREAMTNSASLEFLGRDRTLRAVLSGSDIRTDLKDYGEMANTNYGIIVSKDFLPTLHGSLNASRSENMVLGVDTMETDRYGLHLDAQLYPDLEASLGVAYNLTTNLTSGLETNTTEVDWDLTSRLKPNLTLAWSETFMVTERANTSEDTLESGLDLSWQPSEILSFSSSGRYEDNMTIETERWRVAANMSMLIGLSMALEINYQYNYDEFYVQTGRLSLRWTISRYMSFQTGFDYIEAENQVQNEIKIFSRLQVNFGIK